MIKLAFNFKSQGTKITKLFSHGTEDSINMRYEILVSFDYKCKELSVLLSWI